MIALVWTANFIIIALVAGLAYLMKFSGTEFALGVVFGGAIYNIAHRLFYGRWF